RSASKGTLSHTVLDELAPTKERFPLSPERGRNFLPLRKIARGSSRLPPVCILANKSMVYSSRPTFASQRRLHGRNGAPMSSKKAEMNCIPHALRKLALVWAVLMNEQLYSTKYMIKIPNLIATC